MIIIEFFQALFLPSVFIFLLFVISGISFFLKKKKISIVFLLLAILFYYLFSITPVADFLLLPLESRYRYPSEDLIQKTDLIIVLSGGVKNRDLKLPSALGDSTLFRLTEALKVYSLKKEKPEIIVAGTSPIDRYSKESLFGANFLELYGVPKNKVSYEIFSENTFGHAEQLKKILKKKEFLLVTSAYHMPRSMNVFQKAGFNPIPVPTDYRTEKYYNLISFLPQPNNLVKTNIALHEYFGILYYKLFK